MVEQTSGNDRTQPRADYRIQLQVDPKHLSREAFSVRPEGRTITLSGGDRRGLIYAALALAESLATPLS
jgi:hypothetical protein